VGDVWNWTALDGDRKAIPSYMLGGGESAAYFIEDLKDRLANRVQLTADRHKA